jgi:hypothetical protein
MGKWRETIGQGFGTATRKGSTQKKPVVNENTGKVGGYHVEHWDDRVDAVVKPYHIEVTRESVLGGGE